MVCEQVPGTSPDRNVHQLAIASDELQTRIAAQGARMS
jgi:hypothetical protein